VDPLEAGGVHEDLPVGTWLGRVTDLVGVELQGDVGLAGVIGPGIGTEGVGAYRRIDEFQQPPQDAVVIEALELVEFREHRRSAVLLRLGVGGPVGVEARVDVLHQRAHRLGVGGEDRVHVGRGVGGAELAPEATEGTQDGDVPPGELGDHDELVERIDLEVPTPGGQDGVGDAAAVGDGVQCAGTYPEVVQCGLGSLGALQFVGHLVHDREAEALEDRQERGQLQGVAALGGEQPDRRRGGVGGRAQRDQQLILGVRRARDQQHVDHRFLRVGGLPVADRQPLHDTSGECGRGRGRRVGRQVLAHRLLPGTHQPGQRLGQSLCGGGDVLAEGRRIVRCTQLQQEPHHRVALEVDGGVDLGAAGIEPLDERGAEAARQLRLPPLAWQRHHHRHRPAGAVGVDEGGHPAVLLGLQQPDEQLTGALLRGAQQLVLGQGVRQRRDRDGVV